jgi:hypothetical protein
MKPQTHKIHLGTDLSHEPNIVSVYLHCSIELFISLKYWPNSKIIINNDQQDATIFDLFISSLLYMFRATSSPII